MAESGSPQSMGTESAYDDEVKDLLQQQLYTQDWEIRGSLEGCAQAGVHAHCTENGVCGNIYFKFVYTELPNNDAAEDRIIQITSAGGNESIEIIPSDSSLFGKYWKYFEQRVFDGIKGECLVSVCRPGVKSPSFDVLNCVVARTGSSPPQNHAHVQQDRCYWVLFIPNSVVSSLVDSLNELGVMPVPSAHDAQSYNSSRVCVTQNTVLSEIEPGEWTTGPTYRSISRFISCDAVATATFTVSILLTPYARARGSHTSKKYMILKVHNVK